MPLEALGDIQTPAYILDVSALKRNLNIMAGLKARTGVKILLATKAFAMLAAFPFMREVLDGTTASGPYEARLGAEHFGKEVHTYSPAFTQDALSQTLEFSSHIYFNSVSQLQRFAPFARERRRDITIGLRINPRLSLVKNSALYDPSAPYSRFGIAPDECDEDLVAQVDILHFHNLCENMAEDSAALIDHVMDQFGWALEKVKAVNFGGGHYLTHPDYKTELLIEALSRLRDAYELEVILEPGGAHVLNAGYLVAAVIDVIERDMPLAILDASASTHMPDVLEVPYRPNIVGSGNEGEKSYSYFLGGNTCMTGDVIGSYSFDQPLMIGQKLIFTDMMQYSFVKNTNFNGVPLPDLGILHEDGRYERIKRFGYDDFISRLGGTHNTMR